MTTPAADQLFYIASWFGRAPVLSVTGDSTDPCVDVILRNLEPSGEEGNPITIIGLHRGQRRRLRHLAVHALRSQQRHPDLRDGSRRVRRR